MKHGGGSIMIWGCFSWHGVGHLHKIDGIMNARGYIDIIKENLEPSVQKMGISEKYIFMHDNDPKHTALITQRFLRKSRIKFLEWPSQSADLNPIENIWSTLDSDVSPELRKNKESFFRNLSIVWNQISPALLKNLVESMPRRLQAVIKAKGGNTKY